MSPQDRTRAVPVALWTVIGVFAGAALITVVTAMAAGILGLPALLVAVALGVLALQLYRGGRVARALAAVTAVTLLLLSLATGISGWWVVVGVTTTVVAAVLVLAPSSRAFFAGPFGRAPATAVSVVLVQIVACVISGLLALGAFVMFGVGLFAVGSGAAAGSSTSSEIAGAVGGLFGMLGSVAIALALVYAAVAAFWLWAARALVRGSRGARIAVTVVAGIDALPLLLLLPGVTGGLALTGLLLHGAVIGALWLPTDARRHFGDAPLPAVERWHQQAVALGASIAASAPTVGAPTAGGSPAAPHSPAARMPVAPTLGAWSPAPPSPAAGTPMPTGRSSAHPPPAAGTPMPTGRSSAHPSPAAGTSLSDTPARGVVVPGPWGSPPVARAPRSFPVPAPRADEDPITAPIAVGRHARRDAGAIGQPT